MSNRIYELSKSEFESLIKSSHNIKEVLFKLKLTTIGNSWAYSLVKKRMSELGLNGGDFIGKSALIHAVYKNKRRDEEIFIENSSVQRPIVRKKIIDENLLEYKCACCGISTWQGKDLSLELDHINGINNDHRLENLRFLCPNCHSQTETYGSKNLNKTFINDDYEVISVELREKIKEEYKKLHNVTKVKETLKIKPEIISVVIKEEGLDKKSNKKYVIRYDLSGNELARFGSINEACQQLIDNNEVKTKLVKTARNTFLRNYKKIWLNSKWEVIENNDV